MKDWNCIYKERGILQKEASENVIEAVNFFKQELVRIVLDLGCGTGRHTAYLHKEEIEPNTRIKIQIRKWLCGRCVRGDSERFRIICNTRARKSNFRFSRG